MGDLKDFAKRKMNPVPFSDTGELNWNDLEIGPRILALQLDSETDMGSRRRDTILAESAFLDGCFQTFLEKPGRLLDFTCGPGLYSVELARKGHKVTGVDYNPAAIECAKEVAKQSKLKIRYIQKDAREVEFKKAEFDGCWFIYGQPNAFMKKDLKKLTEKIYNWLAPGGVYVSEIMSEQRLMEDCTNTWNTLNDSIFLNRPQLWLDERTWHSRTRSQAHRVYTVDLETAEVREFSVSHQAYTVKEYRNILTGVGFKVADVFEGLTGEDLSPEPEWISFVAIKPK